MSDLCVGIPDSQLPTLYAKSTHLNFKKGEMLFADDDQAEHIYNIQEGAVTIFRIGPSGQRQVLGFLMTGDILGISPGETYGVSAAASADTKLCRWDRSKFEDFLVLYPVMAKQFRLIASKALARSIDLAYALGQLTAEQRLAAFFIHLGERQQQLGGSPYHVFLLMSRSDIGDHLGLTIETVSRGITKLKKKDIIELPHPDYIHVLKMNALKELADGG